MCIKPHIFYSPLTMCYYLINHHSNYTKSTMTTTKEFSNVAVRLTRREIEILNFISRGKTTKDIASQLFISEYTVNNHRKSMLRKSGAKNCVELMFLLMTGTA